jgi:5'-nucleotidase
MKNVLQFSLRFGFLLLFACSSAQKNPDGGSFSEPRSGLETVAIVGTNDIHGTLAPLSLKTRETENSKPVSYEAGGAAYLASYIQILRSEFGEHLIWLDAGDEFQGSVESNLAQGAPMVKFFNLNQLNAAAIGNHEFDFGVPSLQSRMSEALYPYVAANITDVSTKKLAQFPNTHPSLILNAGRLKVGVIGLSTLETPTSTRAENVRNFHFEDLKGATLREAASLRQQGAKVILITAHVGLKCDAARASYGHTMRKETDVQGECGDQDEMVRLLRSLPAGTVDGVISGHSHQVVHHWVAGVPVIQGGAFGRYLNVIYLTYDWSQKKILSEQTRIEGPIPVCSQVFQNQNDCNGDRPRPKNGRGPLVQAKFHGVGIQADPRTAKYVTPVLEKAEKAKQKVIGQAARPIDHPRNQESPLGNLVADAMRHVAKTDFALINPGGVRAPLEAGPITYGAVFRSMPFDNRIARIHLTPQELKAILRVAESGARGFASISGLKLKLIDPAYDAPLNDLDGDGQQDPWEANRLLEITLPNGEPLQDQKLYTLALSDFLVTGGDGFQWPMSKIPASRIELDAGMSARDALIQYLQENGAFNSESQPLVDQSNRRLQFEKPIKPEGSSSPNKRRSTHKRKRH